MLLLQFHFIGDGATLESVLDLVKAMYLNVESFPCVRLLNLSGEIGCSNPGSEKVIAPIVRLRKGSDQLVQPSTILLSLDQMSDFFLRVSNDPELHQKVAGVFVESNGVNNDLQELSPDRKFPKDDFALYSNHSHDWNPVGSGIMWNKYNFHVFLLSEESTNTLQKTTKAQTHDSASCLKEQSCLPLGGHRLCIIFRDRSLGSDSPISGLIALLIAIDALSHIHGLSKLKKQLVFAVFNGEAWGYLGSRKFLHELDEGAASVNGISSLMIDQVSARKIITGRDNLRLQLIMEILDHGDFSVIFELANFDHGDFIRSKLYIVLAFF
ncbi:Nicastrin [Zea mays]|uniref:Nicastrin n=2 Tax=Zea mays TaxID=4577 RepID=A0A1D6FHR1_MAIZE|nr:Nicastrin [Zea mays]